MRFPTSHRWTVYVTLKSPKGWHKTQICYFSSKIQILSKKVEKILRQSFFVWKLVATSFLCLAVHRWIAGNVPICLKFALKVTHPSENADFDRFRLTVPHPRELARKVQLSIIGSRHTRFPSSHRWTLCVTPKSPKGWHNPSSKTAFKPAAQMLYAVTQFPQHHIFHTLCMFYITVISILDMFLLPTTAVGL